MPHRLKFSVPILLILLSGTSCKNRNYSDQVGGSETTDTQPTLPRTNTAHVLNPTFAIMKLPLPEAMSIPADPADYGKEAISLTEKATGEYLNGTLPQGNTVRFISASSIGGRVYYQVQISTEGGTQLKFRGTVSAPLQPFVINPRESPRQNLYDYRQRVVEHVRALVLSLDEEFLRNHAELAEKGLIGAVHADAYERISARAVEDLAKSATTATEAGKIPSGWTGVGELGEAFRGLGNSALQDEILRNLSNERLQRLVQERKAAYPAEQVSEAGILEEELRKLEPRAGALGQLEPLQRLIEKVRGRVTR